MELGKEIRESVSKIWDLLPEFKLSDCLCDGGFCFYCRLNKELNNIYEVSKKEK